MIDYAQQLNDAVQWILSSTLPPQEKVLIILLLRNGLRVSEITEPASISKIDDWSVSVYCRKNKTYRICTLAEASMIEQQYQVLASIASWRRNRFYYYRLLRGLLSGVETARTGNTAVTHAARNIRAQQTFDATGQIEAAQASLGHRSSKSTQTYLKPHQKVAKVLRGIDDHLSGTLSSIQVTRRGVIRNSRSK